LALLLLAAACSATPNTPTHTPARLTATPLPLPLRSSDLEYQFERDGIDAILTPSSPLQRPLLHRSWTMSRSWASPWTASTGRTPSSDRPRGAQRCSLLENIRGPEGGRVAHGLQRGSLPHQFAIPHAPH